MTESEFPAEICGFPVEKRLGNGAYGVTYLVRGPDKVPYALKILRTDAPAEGRQRFENEEHALKSIEQKAFPYFVRADQHDGRPVLIMQYAEGQTVKSWIESNIAERTFFGTMRMLTVVEQILDGLSEAHKIPILHRDIKDDNVIISTSGQEATILDLGQSTGRETPHPDITFWNIGAARFSPPSKLQNPSIAVASHDVFSVGVMAYRMLTNRFPWEVPPSQDVGFLREKMLSELPAPIQQINSAVDGRVAGLIARLIEREDYLRPEAEAALAQVRELRRTLDKETLNGVAFTTTGTNTPLRLSEVTRDSLHGDIRLTEFEMAVIDTREFQRLRRLRQLGTTHLVYNGAEHTRLAHAIGTMEVADRIMRSIEVREGPQFSAFDKQAARLFALIHDITHAPFGHTLEDELGFYPRHDHNSERMERLIRNPAAELPELLQATDFGRVVLDLTTTVEPRPEHDWILDLVGSPIGADVIDYVDRDALHCGLDHRIDSALYRSFVFVESRTPKRNRRVLRSKLSGQHGFRLDRDFAIGSILRERLALFMKAYSHPKKIAAGAMIGKALAYAHEQDASAFGEPSVEVMGDDELLLKLAGSPSPRAAALGRAVLERKLYQPVYRGRVMSHRFDEAEYVRHQDMLSARGLVSPAGRAAFERDLANAAGVGDDQVVFYCSPKAPGAKAVSKQGRVGEGSRPTKSDPMRDHVDIFRRHLELWNIYVFVDPSLPLEKRQLLAKIVGDDFDRDNEVEISYRQTTLAW